MEWERKVGVDEKKKTQGMRRDSAHFCGVFIIFVVLCHFFSFLFHTILGVCFLGGRKLEGWDEKEN